MLSAIARVAAWATAVAVMLAVVLILWRRRSTSRAIRTRVRFAVLSTETFDPSDEEILRYAHRLTRVRRVVLGLLDRPASAVRIRLESLPGGRVAYLVEGPARAASVLGVAGYEEVEVRTAGRGSGSSPPPEER